MNGSPGGERLDVFDDAGRHVGVKPRALAHRDGDWHRTFHLWVCGVIGGVPSVVLQRRGRDREQYPGLLDVAAGGHLLAGETPADGVREVHEELGIDVSYSGLVALGEWRSVMRDGDIVDREMVSLHALRDERRLSAFPYDRSEVDGLVRLPLAGALALVQRATDGVDCEAIIEPGARPVAHRVSRDDLVDPGSDYWPFALAAVGRLLATRTTGA